MREKLSYPVRIIISLLSIFLWSFPAEGQDSISLKKQLNQKLNSFARQYVSSRAIKKNSIFMQKKKVTLFANEALEDILFREYNVSELYTSIATLFPYASKIIILTRGTDIESLIPEYDRKGRPNKKRLYSIKKSNPLLTRSLSSPHEIKNGLQNRHIALWQSRDLYYAKTAHRWEWQRARMFGAVENLFTQSFVLPYLTPMLENAGATTLIPRKRDAQIHEIIIDNDHSTPGSEYKELNGEKTWSDGEKAGFGHIQATYTNGENLFTQGTYRQTVTQRKGKDSIYSKSTFLNDYQDDIHVRPRWVNYLKEQGHIPIDMAFAFHSDAGITPDDSIIETLGIYMSKSNNGIYNNRKSRETVRDLTDMILTQILSDVRKVNNPQWSRWGMWNQPYIEARIPDVPTMLLELLSHQNFADICYGLDPRFRFLISRATYKGILRYICFQNGQEPIVQPLPPDQLYTEFIGTNKVRIGWKAIPNTIEESASPTAYILYSRKDSGGFNNGTLIKGEEIILSIEAGIIHSYKTVALNKGSISSPSEIVSIYRSPKGKKDKTVLIVNGFNRISSPASFESAVDSLACFLYAADRRVPYLNDIAFIGDQFEFRHSVPWNNNDNNGHRDSYNNYASQVIAGNTFDYPFIHGQAIAEAGYSFVSRSHKSLIGEVIKPDTYPIIDLILGKQRQPVITPALQDTLCGYLAKGDNLLVSGTNLFSDSQTNAQDRTFVEEVLKGKLASGDACKEGIVYEGKYRTCLLGFPFETLQTPSERNRLMESILHFFSIQQHNKIQYIQ